MTEISKDNSVGLCKLKLNTWNCESTSTVLYHLVLNYIMISSSCSSCPWGFLVQFLCLRYLLKFYFWNCITKIRFQYWKNEVSIRFALCIERTKIKWKASLISLSLVPLRSCEKSVFSFFIFISLQAHKIKLRYQFSTYFVQSLLY